jgi:hypothetical protein
MTDTTVTTETPQNQPGPPRTADGTIADSTTNPLTTSDKSPTDKSTDDGKGSSFLTTKPEGKKTEGETKPTDSDKKLDDKGSDGKDADAKPEGAPEKYADFKLPDGLKIDEKVMGEATILFKTLNLSQEAAQSLVDFQAKNLQAISEAPFKAWADTQKEWLADINDRFGSKADAVRTDINKAITNVLPPSLARSFRAAIDVTGAGSNPDIVEALHIMLKPFVEGGSVRGNGPVAVKAPGAPERPSAAEAMYPHLIQNRPSQ